MGARAIAASCPYGGICCNQPVKEYFEHGPAHSVGASSSPNHDNIAAQVVNCAPEAEEPIAVEAGADGDCASGRRLLLKELETKFHEGECVDPEEAEVELVEVEERSSPLFGALSVQHWSTLLSRRVELEAAQRPGRKMVEIKQIKAVDDLFHSELHSLSPKNDADL